MSLKILIIGKEPEGKKQEELYKNIKSIVAEYGHEVLSTPNDIDTENEFGDYQDTFNNIKDADLIILESTKESTRQGMEVREADLLGKPLIILAEEGTEISSLVAGLPLLHDIIYYSNIEDIRDALVRNMAVIEEVEN